MAPRKRGRPVNGWLIIDKPLGLTSTQVVGRVRRLMDAAKVGHAGTLDPLATGVLPIALGEATKTVGYAMDDEKEYTFTLQFGEERDTDDREGRPIATSEMRPSLAEIEAALPGFRGEIMQTPPIYSAIKIGGERAYALARGGETPELAPRLIWIGAFDLIGQPDADHASFRVLCGKGSYIRALGRDLGRILGCYAHVTELRRTRVGPFREEAAISLEKLADLCQNPATFGHLLPVETALDDIPALAVTAAQADRLRQGQAIRVLDADDGLVLITCGEAAVALGEALGHDIRPVRVFNL